jgi:predicted alpha-1,6-mannanase (GH76 family)
MLAAIMPAIVLGGLLSHDFATRSAAAQRVAQQATPGGAVAARRSAGLAATRARIAINSFDRAFYSVRNKRGHFVETTGGGSAKFWKQAEMMEMVEDAYERSGDPAYKRMIRELHAGVVSRFGTTWLRNRFNDDIMWMVVAFLRAYELTGDSTFRTQAKRNFDRVYARAHSADFGGGLWWTTSRREKNACVTAPAAIAACLLTEDLGNRSYLRKATALFDWLDATLYDPASGAVYDHVHRSPGGGAIATDYSTYTYNQGTFIGAADLLHRETGKAAYYDDAIAAIEYAQGHLTVGGILRSEGSGGDGGGFKGIFARWTARFAKDNGVTAFDRWLDRNADAVWSHRNARNLTGEDWAAPTLGGRLHAFDCSSAVVMMQVRP